jgi:hypothetical protein
MMLGRKHRFGALETETLSRNFGKRWFADDADHKNQVENPSNSACYNCTEKLAQRLLKTEPFDRAFDRSAIGEWGRVGAS